MNKNLILRFFDAASMQRWNDHVRPLELTELDKQAHKAIIAYVIAKFEEEDSIDWNKIIEGSIFECLQRIVLTDIKPQVYRKIINFRRKHIISFVKEKIKDDLVAFSPALFDSFCEYIEDQNPSKEKKILKAAHYLATLWEFNMIYPLSKNIYGIEETKTSIENEIEDYYELIGVQKLLLRKKIYGFIDLCGQLRFQQRWAQSPRLPKTNVLGHMFFVAVLSYLYSEKFDFCSKRKRNNFFVGLFHDLPEALTKDIISPVKRGVEGLEEVINEYEKSLIDERILPLLPESWHWEIKYFIEDEFKNKALKSGKIEYFEESEENQFHQCNKDNYFQVDGALVKICDDLAAFVEANLSLSYGVSSNHLIVGIANLCEKYKDKKYKNYDISKTFKEMSLFKDNFTELELIDLANKSQIDVHFGSLLSRLK